VNELMNLPPKDLTVSGKIPMGRMHELISKTNNKSEVMTLAPNEDAVPLEANPPNEDKAIARTGLGEFCLMLFIQACSLCQMTIRPNNHIHDIVCPAKDLVSMKHIRANMRDDELELTDDNIDEITDATMRDLGFPNWQCDMMETCFCESHDMRAEKHRNFFFKGQFFFVWTPKDLHGASITTAMLGCSSLMTR